MFVLKANDNIESDYLHYVIANDKFINFVMSGAKGVKMVRLPVSSARVRFSCHSPTVVL